MHHPELASIVRYVELSPTLATAGQPTEEQLAQMLKSGFNVVINLGLHTDVSYALPDERGTVISRGAKYVHIPVEFGAPLVSQVREFCAVMAASADRKVFVHCRHNKRVPVFVALDRVLRQRWTVEAAFGEMNAVWVPDEAWSKFIELALSSASTGAEP